MNAPGDTPIFRQAPAKASFLPSEEEVNIREVFRVLWRRKWMVIVPTIIATLLAAVLVVQITSVYTATTDLFIETRRENIIDLQSVLSEGLTTREGIESEMQVIRSANVVSKVIDQLNLMDDPEFNPELRQKSALSEFLDWRAHLDGTWIGELIGGEGDEASPEEKLERQQALVLENVRNRLETVIKGESNIISISFTSENPRKAAMIANTVADTYILDQLEAKYEATRRATQWLTGKINELRQSVDANERAVEEFRKQMGLFVTKDGTLQEQQIANLSAELIVARTQRAEAEARLSQVRQLIRASGGAGAAADVLDSPVIQGLLAQEAEVKRKVAELSDEFGARHPRMISVRAELADLQGKLRTEVDKIVQALANEVGVAEARQRSLERSLDQMKSGLAISNQAEVQLRSLERDADAERELLETFLGRFEETSAQLDTGVNHPDARIISPAATPEDPSFPPRKVIVAAVMVVAGFLSVIAVFVIEQMDRGYRSGEQIESGLGLRALGLVPSLKKVSRARTPPHDYVLKYPSSLFGEAIRSFYRSVLLSTPGPAPKTVLITSSQPKEGKSTLAICLARARSFSGRKTVVLETDLRRPHIHSTLKLPRQPGLVEYVAGEAPLEAILHKDEPSGAYIIPAGRMPSDPAEVLASVQMDQLMATLTREFDLVILDSPPVMAVADARVLVPRVDTTVFVVHWAKTDREVVKTALKQVFDAKGHVSGVVLTMVDPKKHARYGFGDSSHYYPEVRGYYTTT